VLCPFDPGLLLDLIETERPAIVAAAATMLEILAGHPESGRRDVSSVRVLCTGAMPVRDDLIRRAESGFGARVQVSYGQTETCGLTHAVPLGASPEVRLHTVGCPLPQVEVRVADPDSGRTQALGAIGEVLIRGYQVMAGYFELPEATAAAIDAEGCCIPATWARWTPTATCGSRVGSRK
jgi:fatty-acyl-CoA synthase